MTTERTLDAPSREVPGHLTLFGHGSTPASVRLVARSRRWRTGRALRILGVGLLLTPLVALIPPHAPWALGALVGSGLLARRRLQERLTLLSLEGTCPRCGEAVRLEGPLRLRAPQPVPCEACHHESALRVERTGETEAGAEEPDT